MDSILEIISIMKERIEAYNPGCQTVSIPVADGGEGSVDAFLTALGGEKVRMKTKGPWNEEVDSFYGMLPDGTAVIEMAASAGLPQVGDRKDPSRTTTYGVGELILAAARSGAKRLVIGLGGSATNDAGCGAAAACGVRFLDKDGRSFVPVGGTLGDIASIDLSGMDGKVKDMPITAMCDIDNPFYGPTGAAAIFGPQKGADEAMVADLDGKMKHLASVIEEQIGVDLQEIPGSGAAGGMGGGMKAFFGARMQMGIDAVLETTGFEIPGAVLGLSRETGRTATAEDMKGGIFLPCAGNRNGGHGGYQNPQNATMTTATRLIYDGKQYRYLMYCSSDDASNNKAVRLPSDNWGWDSFRTAYPVRCIKDDRVSYGPVDLQIPGYDEGQTH